jgi:hypothetical protein
MLKLIISEEKKSVFYRSGISLQYNLLPGLMYDIVVGDHAIMLYDTQFFRSLASVGLFHAGSPQLAMYTVIWFDFGVKNSSRLARSVNNQHGKFFLKC